MTGTDLLLEQIIQKNFICRFPFPPTLMCGSTKESRTWLFRKDRLEISFGRHFIRVSSIHKTFLEAVADVLVKICVC